MKRWQIYLLGWLLVLSVPGMVMGEPCDARPRWLVVTIVRLDWYSQRGDGEGLEKQEPLSGDVVGGGRSEMLDRCNGTWLISDKTSFEEHPIQSEISINAPDSTLVYGVVESVQEICAVLDDCGNATSADVER